MLCSDAFYRRIIGAFFARLFRGFRRSAESTESPLCSRRSASSTILRAVSLGCRVPELLPRDQPAVNSLPQRLAYKRPLDRAGLYQVKNSSQRPSVFVARSGLYFALEQVAIMENDNSRDIAVTPEVRRNVIWSLAGFRSDSS